MEEGEKSGEKSVRELKTSIRAKQLLKPHSRGASSNRVILDIQRKSCYRLHGFLNIIVNRSGQNMMTFDAMVDALNLEAMPERLINGCDSARESYPVSGAEFLSDSSLDNIFRVCNFTGDIGEPLAQAVELIRKHLALYTYAWLWHSVLFFSDDHPERGAEEWPLPQYLMGELAPLFPAAIVLTGFPRMFALHRERGIPEAVTRATCSDLAIWMHHYRKINGIWGFTSAHIPWLMSHCRGEIFRVGRLQYKQVSYSGNLRAFKHRKTGEVLALTEAGISYTRDGLVDGTNHFFDEQAWVSELEIEDKVIRGHPIVPTGYVLRERRELPAELWEQKLAPGDPVLDIHIPADGRMSYQECGESLLAANEFFPRHFPEIPSAAAFVCFTWFLDSQLQQMLPPSSNIVSFQREFYLSPALSYKEETLRRIFGSLPADLSKAPRNTTLERAVLDFTQAGHGLRCAWGFMLREGLSWGSQQYQKELIRGV